jgi:ABC-type Fe3+-siderophore transport system permease subunit
MEYNQKENVRERTTHRVKVGKLATIVGATLMASSIAFGKLKDSQPDGSYTLPMGVYSTGTLMSLIGASYVLANICKREDQQQV